MHQLVRFVLPECGAIPYQIIEARVDGETAGRSGRAISRRTFAPPAIWDSTAQSALAFSLWKRRATTNAS